MRALIVDDSRFLRQWMQRAMQAKGWECAEAEHGQAALDVLREKGAFELMLLDVNMPVMNGLECVRELRASGAYAGMKVMMVTTEADSSFVATALQYGADEFLMKPVTDESLQSKLLLLGLQGGR